MSKEKKSESITLKVSEPLYEVYTKTLSEVEREKWRHDCRELLARMGHAKQFNPSEWDLNGD